MLLSIKEQHKHGGTTGDVSDATSSGCEVDALVATRGPTKELGFTRRRRY